ncbi:DNA polymerase III subunit chi [Rhizobium rhizosphaerae]|uniref:DNA polymerase III subunit chi n=1 Tax=Xaviernesmea rhizosphaerae TaxID=1672749 RepID=A0A1Q9AKR4_9HYPH|nr:DNA polymerase III subunit chi [Xaviernesmea rhizosphaerae]OLP55908.1 DNA polymerase III subunit chi [Xaviernesmea rhizosphaerae]
MTEILFYHLTESKLEDALPPLLEKSLERGWKVVLQLAEPQECERLDEHLWTYRAESFLPHGLEDGPMPADQPILLTSGAGNGNGADVRFVAGGAEPPPLEGYQRVVIMFDGYDAGQLERARGQWKRLKEEGHALTYWQQNADGRWVKKA